MTEREKLIRKLKDMSCYNQEVLEFILTDRKRIVQPLIDFSNQPHTTHDYEARAANAMVKTLINAGIK